MKSTMFTLASTVLLLLISLTCHSQEIDISERTKAIISVIRQQEAGWNRGSVEAYMEGYAKGAETRFISGGTVTIGFDTVLVRYKRGYPDRASMGKLSFSDIQIEVLAYDLAIVYGKWALQREKDNPWGRFTLLFKNLEEGWRIVHDHTSVAK
jgi:ketosteroid isomerase-like protein